MAQKTPLGGLELARAKPLRRQVAELLRAAIRRRQWKPGERLPTAKELATLWHTDQGTVHWGLAQLVREGLVERAPRRGTFVRENRPVLKAVGIYTHATVLEPGAAPFAQAIMAAVRAELQRVRFGLMLFVDPRPEQARAEPWPQLVQAIARREVQALIVPTSDPSHTDWLVKLPVPMALLSSGPRATLGHDNAQFMELAVSALAAQGCQRVGMICPLAGRNADAVLRFVDLAADRHLTIRDAWMGTAQADPFRYRYAQGQHRFGYETMHRLWAQAERPDGLIVCPDSVATGVILALAELGVKVPGDVRLVVHRNRGVPLLCPFPATFVELDPAEAAEVLVQQVRELYAGRLVAQATLRYVRVEPS